MNISPLKNTISYKGAMNNKLLLNGLEAISNHPASFIAGTTLLMSSVVRPIAISLTPKTDKENKKYAIADSISSGLIKFGITEMIAYPVENAIKTINKNPEKYLNNKAIKAFKDKGKSLVKSKNYKFGQEIIKLAPNLITAIPKSMIAVALIPVITDKLFPKKTEKKSPENISFKGIPNTAVKGVSNVFNSKIFQNFIKKNSFNADNIARNMYILTDILLAGSFALRTKKSKKIKEDKKNPLIYNKLISTTISVIGGYKIDDMLKKGSKSFMSKFKKANINNPKLEKYIQGFNILRPTIAFALLYYGILPVLSTFTADKIDKFQKNKNK